METMCYYVPTTITLDHIAALAEKQQGYSAYFITKPTEQDQTLNIEFGPYHEYGLWWQWFTYSRYEFERETSTNAESYRLERLRPQTILVFGYHTFTLNEVVKFMRVVMTQYGGVLDCRATVRQLYSLHNLDKLLHDCARAS
jgi:hypothetical protein